MYSVLTLGLVIISCSSLGPDDWKQIGGTWDVPSYSYICLYGQKNLVFDKVTFFLYDTDLYFRVEAPTVIQQFGSSNLSFEPDILRGSIDPNTGVFSANVDALLGQGGFCTYRAWLNGTYFGYQATSNTTTDVLAWEGVLSYQWLDDGCVQCQPKWYLTNETLNFELNSTVRVVAQPECPSGLSTPANIRNQLLGVWPTTPAISYQCGLGGFKLNFNEVALSVPRCAWPAITSQVINSFDGSNQSLPGLYYSSINKWAISVQQTISTCHATIATVGTAHFNATPGADPVWWEATITLKFLDCFDCMNQSWYIRTLPRNSTPLFLPGTGTGNQTGGGAGGGGGGGGSGGHSSSSTGSAGSTGVAVIRGDPPTSRPKLAWWVYLLIAVGGLLLIAGLAFLITTCLSGKKTVKPYKGHQELAPKRGGDPVVPVSPEQGQAEGVMVHYGAHQ